jgi:hypothetical protein
MVLVPRRCASASRPPAPSNDNAASTNAHIPHQVLRKFCALDEAGERTLEMAVQYRGLDRSFWS